VLRSGGDRASIDAAVTAIAAAQHGVVTTAQVIAAGWSRDAIRHRVDRGWFRPVHRGVCVVGPVAAPLAFEQAGLLACGEGSILGYASVAAMSRLARRPELVDVIVRGSRRSHKGITLHRDTVPPSDRTIRHGLAVTTVDRTLRDLAGVLTAEELDRVVNEALVQRLVTVQGLLASVERSPRRRGAARLRELLHDHHGITRSEAERALKRLIRRSGIPEPRTNARVAGYEVDCHWSALALVVEVDSASVHGTPRSFQADRAKEAALVAAGQRLIRVTRWEVVRRPEATIARLAVATAARPP
jgi:very-short-patch-repair endonuclease